MSVQRYGYGTCRGCGRRSAATKAGKPWPHNGCGDDRPMLDIEAPDAAPTPPEIVQAAVLEEVARALYEAADYEAPSWRPKWDDLDEDRRQTWRRLAAAAVAAYRAQDGGAEEALRRVTALAAELDSKSPQASAWHVANRIRAALAPQAGDER